MWEPVLPASVCRVWSLVGPVPRERVEPLLLIQSKSSVLSGPKLHRSASNVHDLSTMLARAGDTGEGGGVGEIE